MVSDLSNKVFRNSRSLVRVVAVLFAVGLASPLSAQEGPSVDLGTGLLSGFGGGHRYYRFGAAVAGQVVGKPKSKGAYSLLVGFNAALSLILHNSDECLIALPVVPEMPVRCVPDFPDAGVFSVVTGVERRLGRNIAVRALVGPAVYRPFDGLHAKWGAQSRVDIAFHTSSRVAFVLWAQPGLMPIEKSPVGVPLLYGLGMRVQ